MKLCGAGEWLVEKHGTKTRRSWRKLHIGMDATTGEIVAAALTTNDVDDARQIATTGLRIASSMSRNSTISRSLLAFWPHPSGRSSTSKTS